MSYYVLILFHKNKEIFINSSKTEANWSGSPFYGTVQFNAYLTKNDNTKENKFFEFNPKDIIDLNETNDNFTYLKDGYTLLLTKKAHEHYNYLKEF